MFNERSDNSSTLTLSVVYNLLMEAYRFIGRSPMQWHVQGWGELDSPAIPE